MAHGSRLLMVGYFARRGPTRLSIWQGASRESYAKTVGRTLQAVFRKSGGEKAISHRFRHTLVNKILAKGGTFEDAATILGDSPAIIRKHYHHWSVETQARMVEVLRRVHGTFLAHGKNQSVTPLVSGVQMVAEVGVGGARAQSAL
ncbi:MAG: phage integrase family protein [Bryobacterales bacterium]|nr:phage integrase family protein [Bryobacterales bacterium]